MFVWKTARVKAQAVFAFGGSMTRGGYGNQWTQVRRPPVKDIVAHRLDIAEVRFAASIEPRSHRKEMTTAAFSRIRRPFVPQSIAATQLARLEVVVELTFVPLRSVPARTRWAVLPDHFPETKNRLLDRFVVPKLDPNSHRFASCTADAMPEMRVDLEESQYRK
jgi:hypothetical protein